MHFYQDCAVILNSRSIAIMTGSKGFGFQSLQTSRALFRTLMILTSLTFGHLVVRMSRKHNGHASFIVGNVNRRGYGGQLKGTIYDARGPYPSI